MTRRADGLGNHQNYGPVSSNTESTYGEMHGTNTKEDRPWCLAQAHLWLSTDETAHSLGLVSLKKKKRLE